mgnify:CR=1 FL=1
MDDVVTRVRVIKSYLKNSEQDGAMGSNDPTVITGRVIEVAAGGVGFAMTADELVTLCRAELESRR